LKTDGSLNEKFPGRSQAQKEKLENEGFSVIKKNKKYFVQDYQTFIAD
jgi:hypothetical protein